jgi:hypothetical protein
MIERKETGLGLNPHLAGKYQYHQSQYAQE